MNNWCYWIFI